ncbi:hypothetical protein niasHT_029636 [Heterodera trifolii]|uniref:Uncharacterized protein n=1 Tax=Heterodera trifolii TaxID=157864 RepID=A0ABD2K1I5_9BILA
MFGRPTLSLFSLLLFLMSIRRMCCRNANVVVTPSAAVPLFLVDGEVNSLNKNSTPRSSAAVAAVGEMPMFAKNMGGRRLIGGGGDGGNHRWKSEGRTGHLRTLLWHLTDNDHHDQHQQVPMDDNFSATDEEDIRRMIYTDHSTGGGRDKNSNGTMDKNRQRYKNAKETTAAKNGTTIINDKTTLFFINSIKFKQRERHQEKPNTQKMNQGFEKSMKTKHFQHPSSKNGEKLKLRSLNFPTPPTKKKKPTTIRKMSKTTVATTTTMAQATVGTTAQTTVVTTRPTTVVPPPETVAQTTVVTTRLTTVVPPPQRIGKFRQQQQLVNAGIDNRGPPAIAPQSPGTSAAQQLSDGEGTKQSSAPENRGPKQKGQLKAKKPKKNANKIGKKLLLRRIFKTGPHGISRENLNSSSTITTTIINNNNNNTNATKMEPKLRNGITVPLDNNSKNERWNSGGTSNANTAPCNAQAKGGCQLASAQPATDTNCACRANEGNRCGTFGAGECFPSASADEEVIGGGRGSDGQAFVASGIGCHQLDQSECDHDQQQPLQRRRKMQQIVFPAQQKMDGEHGI